MVPGRGLTQAGLQFPGRPSRPAGAILGRAMASRGGTVAPPLRLLPTLIGESVLRTADPAADGAPAGLPFAVEEHRLELVRLDLFVGSPHLLVLGDAECGRDQPAPAHRQATGRPISAEEVALLVVDLRQGLLDLTALPNLAGYACTPATVAQTVEHLHRELTDRTPADHQPLTLGPWRRPGCPTSWWRRRTGPGTRPQAASPGWPGRSGWVGGRGVCRAG